MTKISELPTATTLSVSDTILMSSGGVDKRISIGALDAYVSAKSTPTYNRPGDWLAMPADATNQICILAAVYDPAIADSLNDSLNKVAVNITLSSGTYSVNWGDGTTDTGIASATTQDHTYTYGDTDLNGSESTRGYKQAMITITTSGGNITAFNLSVKNTGVSGNYVNPWLDMQINTPSCTSINIRNTQAAYSLERINFTAIGAVTSLTTAFQNCYALQSVSFPTGSLSGVTTLANAFSACYALQSVSFPSGSLASCTTLSSAFQNCYALQSVSFPSGSLASCTTISNAFQNCSALQSVSFPSGSLNSVTTLVNAFLSCSALQSVSFPSGSLASCTTLANAFQNCYALQSVSFPSGSLASCTTIASAFSGCSALQSIDFPSGWNPTVLVTTTNAFTSCSVLANIDNCAIPVSFSVASCNLSSAALDEIYTALPTAAQTITVTSNYGTTGDTPTIATGKTWTVTGS